MTAYPRERKQRPPLSKNNRRALLAKIRTTLGREALKDTDECWLWPTFADYQMHAQHPLLKCQGYGWSVHRILFEHYRYPLEPREQLYSTCSEEACVNPFHFRTRNGN